MVSKRCSSLPGMPLPSSPTGGPPFVAKVLLEPHLWGKAHRLCDSPHLLEARVLHPALAQVCDVGAAYDTARGLLKLRATPPLAVRTAVDLQEMLEPLRYVQFSAPAVDRVGTMLDSLIFSSTSS